jgi:4-hydroxybenzoate polyprenyltransferase
LKTVYKIIDWLLFTSLFAAFCATGLCMATERLLIGNMPPLFSPLHFLVLGSTLLVYNTHSLLRRSTPEMSDHFGWTQHYRIWHYLFFSLGSFLCIESIFQLNYKIFIACCVLGILSFAYSLPLLPFENKKRLKDFGWVKIVVLVSVWTIVTSVLPILYWGDTIRDYPYEIILRFVFMFTLCVAFDIRDMQTDLEANIFTLPNLIGLRNSYRLMDFTILLFSLLSVFQYLRYPSVTRLVGALLSALVTKWAIEYTKKHPSDRAYLGLIDGMMLLYAMLVLMY